MADQLLMQYVGFTSGAVVRAYSFVVRDEAGPHEYTLTIANEAFVSHRVRYQDGPNICSRRLRHELTANPIDLSATQFCITDPELADYKNDHTPKAVSYFRKEQQD